MGRLDELEEELYGKGEAKIAGRRARRFDLAPAGKNMRTSWNFRSGRTGQSPGRLRSLRAATLVTVLAALLFVAGGAVFVLFYFGTERTQAEVIIGGRDLVEGGEPFALPVVFRNTSAVALEEVQLVVTLPKGSLVRDESGLESESPPRIIKHIGALRPGEEGGSEFIVRLFGREGETQEITAALLYRPKELRARFSSQGSKQVKISRVPLSLFWEIPQTVIPRQDVSMTLRYNSQSRSALKGLWVRVSYPPGFALRIAAPKASVDDLLWNIGTLEPGEEGTIVLSGAFAGVGGEKQALNAGIGAYDELSKEWRPWQESGEDVALEVSPFLLETALGDKREGVVKPGERLSFSVRYKNRSSVGVNNVSIRAAVEGEIADLAALAVGDGGVFDFSSRQIVWGPGGTEKLREIPPGEEGELRFQIAARPRPAVRSAADKNLTLRVRTRISAPDLPQELAGGELAPEDVIEFKVATVVLFSGRTVFRTSPIVNSGPLPPRVGEKTTYAIMWEVRNFTNDLDNAEIAGFVPPNVRWEDAVSPQGADIHFDTASGEVRWRLGKVQAGTGVLTPARIGAFQVSVIPSEIDAGKILTLAAEQRLSGRDAFTGEEVSARIDALTTELRDDPTTRLQEWKVER